MLSNETIIAQTTKWITDVVIACNFCPFAAKEMKKGTVSFSVLQQADKKMVLETAARSFQELITNGDVETILIIMPGRFPNFLVYLDIVDIVQSFLEDEGHEGIFQLASFHPAYLFAGTTESDASNYTNRSPYPVIQILREASISKAVKRFKDIQSIPDNNVAFAKEKGLEQMIALRQACFNA